MPIKAKEIKLRIFCKKCNRYEVHNKMYGDKKATDLSLQNEDEKLWYKCCVCDTEYTDVLFSEIPREEILLQRERYKNQRRRNFSCVFTAAIYGYNSHKEEIYESDAGLLKIEEAKQKEKDEQKQKDLAFVQPYLKLQRNEKCACNSGKKFKVCCKQKVDEIKSKHNIQVRQNFCYY